MLVVDGAHVFFYKSLREDSTHPVVIGRVGTTSTGHHRLPALQGIFKKFARLASLAAGRNEATAEELAGLGSHFPP